MESLIGTLAPLYERERAANHPMVLAVVIRTAGSTYSKCGTPLLIAEKGDYAGLLSGGCLEGDLQERARAVLMSGKAQLSSYEQRGPDDLLFGLGSGCEGSMDIWMLRVGPEQGWQPLAHLFEALKLRRRTAVGLVIESHGGSLAAGAVLLPGQNPALEPRLDEVAAAGEAGWLVQSASLRVFGLPLVLPLRLLVLGAGPDTEPLVDFSLRLGWQVTMYDHRPAQVDARRFSGAERVVLGRPEALAEHLSLHDFQAAVIMSHHLETDGAYLRALARSPIGYVGLLGPAPRRERLSQMLEPEVAALSGRLRSPVGLALGGRSSAAIALSIVAEIQAWQHQRAGGPFSAQVPLEQPAVFR